MAYTIKEINQALEVLGKFEYSSDYIVKRVPSEKEYLDALVVIEQTLNNLIHGR